MVSIDHAGQGDGASRAEPEPVDVVDRLLWRDAQHMLDRHAGPDETGQCAWCGRGWPCAARRLAERAEIASFRPWNEAWTARLDLHSLRATPSWRADHDNHEPYVARNGGAFDRR